MSGDDPRGAGTAGTSRDVHQWRLRDKSEQTGRNMNASVVIFQAELDPSDSYQNAGRERFCQWNQNSPYAIHLQVAIRLEGTLRAFLERPQFFLSPLATRKGGLSLHVRALSQSKQDLPELPLQSAGAIESSQLIPSFAVPPPQREVFCALADGGEIH